MDERNLTAELAVIGAGPGGYEAALHAASLGLDTVLISAEKSMGGVCLHRGCIPSKTLLHAARVMTEAADASRMGLRFEPPKIDLAAMRQWKDGVIARLAKGIEGLCRKHNVRTIHARARFIDAHTLGLAPGADRPADGPETVSFDSCIVATGSLPVFPEAFDIGDPRVMDSTSALALREIPETLLVLGAGYIGLELGTVYASLGSRVTMVEAAERILMGADEDLVKPLKNRLAKTIPDLRLETRVEALRATNSGIEATLLSDGAQTAETFGGVLVSMGRRPVTQGLELENAGLQTDNRGFIVVDEQRRTAQPDIFAIGDVAGDPMLAHKATREGKVAAEAAAGGKAVFDNIAIPAVVFTDPEIAWCGLTEREARERAVPHKVSRFPWSASGRAASLGCTDGVTKILFDPETERVLGVGIAGMGAGDLISEGVVAVEMAAVARDLAESIHPHPTLSETLAEAAGAFLRESNRD